MSNTNKASVLQAAIFILAWTLLWSLINLIFPIKPFTTMAAKPLLSYGSSILPMSLLGSLISYYFVHCIPRLKAKRIVLSVFWSGYWVICLGLQMVWQSAQHTTSISAPHTGPVLDELLVWIFWLCIGLIATLRILAYVVATILPISIIAYLASFAPGLEPKNHTGYLL
jgi:hypothetical protein